LVVLVYPSTQPANPAGRALRNGLMSGCKEIEPSKALRTAPTRHRTTVRP